MNPAQNVRLSDHSTMRLGGTAAFAVEVASRQDLLAAVQWAGAKQLPLIVVGSGSNIIWRDEGFAGLLIINRISGYEVFEEDDENVYLTVGAGENWDSVVERAAETGLTGIEALSLIPGTAGATPVQNVGAYGQEIAQTLVSVEAYDRQAGAVVNLRAEECSLSYRDSRFKTGPDRGRFIITNITLHLRRGRMQPPYYAVLQTYLDEHNLKDPDPATVRAAVIAIRSSRLPDPASVANNGSFFANPIVSAGQFAQLRADFPDIPSWPMPDDRTKIPAAWLVEQAGFKNHRDPATGMATWPQQCLVLINESAKSTADLLNYKAQIVDAVQAKFGITLVQEPELLP